MASNAPVASPTHPRKLSGNYTERHHQMRELGVPAHLIDSPAFIRAINECLAVMHKSAASLDLKNAAILLGHYAPSPALKAIATRRYPR